MDTIRSFTLFILGTMFGMCVMCLLLVIDNAYTRDRSIELGYAAYNSTTGDFEYTNEDIRYLITGNKE